MTEDQLELLEEARDSLLAAKVLLRSGFPGYAASRAYYAMFYVAEAFLEGEQMAFSRHSAVISAFGQHFAHAGKVPQELHRYLLRAQELRLAGDYAKGKRVTPEESAEQIARAEKFLAVAEERIGPLPPLKDEKVDTNAQDE